MPQGMPRVGYCPDSELVHGLLSPLPGQASQPSQSPKEKTPTTRAEKWSIEHIVAAPVEKCSVERIAVAPTERRPAKGGKELSSKKRKHIVQKRGKGAPSHDMGREYIPKKRSKSKGNKPTREAAGDQCRPIVIKDLCKMGGRASEDKYFASRMLDLLVPKAWTLMEARWANLPTPTHFWSDGLVADTYVRGALHPTIAK
ncbi:hypothetical protein GW17_00023307 [Ensete ventricosum]|nr:hypothetical protein GW17_00023307 [Ensete ventricosum]